MQEQCTFETNLMKKWENYVGSSNTNDSEGLLIKNRSYNYFNFMLITPWFVLLSKYLPSCMVTILYLHLFIGFQI